MDSFLVGVINIELDYEAYTLLLTQQELSDLLANLDTEKYKIGNVVNTYSEKKESILEFCKPVKDLEVGVVDGTPQM